MSLSPPSVFVVVSDRHVTLWRHGKTSINSNWKKDCDVTFPLSLILGHASFFKCACPLNLHTYKKNTRKNYCGWVPVWLKIPLVLKKSKYISSYRIIWRCINLIHLQNHSLKIGFKVPTTEKGVPINYV